MTLAYVAIVGAVAFRYRENALVFMAVVIPMTVAFCVICARTTRGGWRWRWGDDD